MSDYGVIDWSQVANLMGATLCHAFGDRGVVFYRHAFRDCEGLNGCQNIILTDNGGEINVMGVNGTVTLPSVPITHGDGYVGPVTVAHRLGCVFNGLPVEYDLVLDWAAA